jgi:hypothetical protein
MPQQLAKVERENIHVMLDANGNQLSWLQIYPRFKIDKEGDRVLSGAEMYLKVAERSNEYLHSADRPPLPGHHREVNCALEQTSWRLKRYQSSTDSVDPNYLLASQLVLISDPETRSNLTIARPPLGALDNAVALDKPQHIHSSGDLGALAELSSSNPLHSNVSSPTLDQHEYIHPYGDMVLEPIPPQDVVDSNHLWFIEAGSILDGGPIRWKTDLVRFKHVNTGQYLAHTEEYPVNEETGEQEEVLIFTTTSHPNTPGTLFNVNELNSTGKLLSNGKALQIGQAGSWIERGDVSEDSVLTFLVRGTHDRANALSLLIHRAGGHNAASNAAAGDDDHSEVIAAHEPLDFFSGLAARNYLRRYHDMTVIPRSDSVNTIWPTAIRTDLEFFQLVVEKTVFFSQGFPIASTGIQLGIDKADAVLRTKRQNLLREQNTLEVVLRMINKLIPITEKLERMKKTDAHHQKKKKPTFSEQEQQMVAMGQLVLGKCFNLLYYTILDNQENQMYVADYMPFLLAHLNVQPLAGKCVTEMLSKNIELQETKIGTREIQIFVDKLRSSKMNAMYLQLLQACCSCEGQGVDGNQCKVANMLFDGDYSDIIVTLEANYGKLRKAAWGGDKVLYLTPPGGSDARLIGVELYVRGLPQLTLKFQRNGESMSVPIEEVFVDKQPSVGALHATLASPSTDDHDDKKALMETKAAPPLGHQASFKSTSFKMRSGASSEMLTKVGNYFIAEMFLGAEMCMDRNYVAINKLKDLFTYEMLVTILAVEHLSSNVKSAAVRLLMCLHVDRDPQAASKIPLLTRSWSDIKKNPEPQLPYVDVQRRYDFGLIQQLISEHITNMAGVRWDDLSRHMLKMLRTLVQFNFYGTNERMTDVIAPLIRALDRRHVGAAEEKEVQRVVAAQAKVIEKEHAVTGPGSAYAAEGGDLEESRQLLEPEGAEASPVEENAPRTGWMDNTKSACKMAMNVLTVGNAARVMATGDDVKEKKVAGFQNPIRYDKAPIYELETMVEAVDILAFGQRVIEDRNISLLLRYFYVWQNESDPRTPVQLFEQVVQDSKELSLDISEFDSVMLDVLMFVHMPLTQSTLEVLMAHHSMRRILLDNAKNVQLLASHDRERQYRIVDQMLQQLEQNAETHELWGELETDADHQTNKQTMEILKDLINICRIRRKVLEWDEEFMADREIQDLYRNLGCFEICMKVMGLLDSVEEDENGNLSAVALNTRELCLRCNTLLYWYFLGNPKNQEQGFGEIELFLDSIDDEINSHLVIGAIFKNNEELMRLIPHSHLSDLVEKIMKNGKSHHYLSLFASISHVGERNIKENQFEIVKTLTSPGRLAKVAIFFCPVDHPDYQQKVALMEPFLDTTTDLSLEDLPPLLAYHLMFLEVLSGCTVGRENITAVEAKVQSVFNYVDILQSILHPGTITIAKTRLCKFFYNSIIEVELKIPGLEQVPVIWQLLESFKMDLNNAKEVLVNAEKLGWQHPTVSRQRIEYLLVCIMIIGGFFQHYYRAGAFQESGAAAGADGTANASMAGQGASQKATPVNKDKANISLTHVDELILYFFHKIKELHDLNSRILSDDTKRTVYDALTTLNKSTSNGAVIAPVYPMTTAALDGRDGDNSEMEVAIDPEQALISKYKAFLKELEDDAECQNKANNENVAFIKILEALPFTYDAVEADVRYETLIRKLVSHIRENIKIVNGQKRLDARVTKTSTWIIRAFRTMIENKMGMSIFERDDDGGAEEDERAEPVVNALNSCGGTALCLDLIADGIDEGLQLEAVKLGVGLLFKEGGALEVQKLMHSHLQKTQSDLFFKQVKITLTKLASWHNWNKQIRLKDDEEPPHPPQILILRFLQLMCEGHFLPNQDIMREQPTNATSYNLLDSYVEYLNCLSRIPCRTSTMAAIRLSATILEVIQGPCEGNQAHFALNTELIETLNRLNRAKLVNDCDESQEVEVKKTCIDIFQGMLEGQGEKSAVYERVLSVIHLDIVQLMSQGTIVSREGEGEDGSLASLAKKVPKNVELEEQKEILQTECVVLLQMLCNFKPSLYEELGISRNIEDIVGSGTAMIEVIWRGDIHRRFFHVPAMCSYLAKPSKDALVANVDRSNAENKLIDFLNRSHELYREAKHQQRLTSWRLAGVFSRKVQDRATWVTFILAFLTNLMLLMYYSSSPATNEPMLQKEAIVVIRTLNLLQVIFAGFVIVLFLGVRSPVRYASLQAAGVTGAQLLMQTIMDPMVLYYCWYFAFTGIGQLYSYDFLPFLLLDIIVKNSTTRDVLNAVIVPRKQIMMGGVVILFIVQVYAFALVSSPSSVN